jgi:3-oxoacyl-[acyl-carrier protein] reductase
MNRTALVTGAGAGIGRTIAHRLAADGRASTIVVTDLVGERAEEVATEINHRGAARAIAAAADVTSWESMESLFAGLASGGVEPVQILVNNAGLPVGDTGGRPFVATDPPEWQRWVGINMFGVMYACRLAAPAMVERGWGRIITIGSAAGRVGEPGLAVYSSVKAGSAGFMRALGAELGPAGITCNMVALGAMRHGADQMQIPDAVRERIVKSYPLRRLGENDDAAAMVSFLAGDDASWVTRQTIAVDGGYTSS